MPSIRVRTAGGLSAGWSGRLCRCRRCHFKCIKQHFRIKKFYGISENAVTFQIWIAVSTYLLVAIVKKRLGLDHSLHSMLQILSLTQFEKTPVDQVFQKQANTHTKKPTSGNS